jgi:ABC-type transporter MlaC component
MTTMMVMMMMMMMMVMMMMVMMMMMMVMMMMMMMMIIITLNMQRKQIGANATTKNLGVSEEVFRVSDVAAAAGDGLSNFITTCTEHQQASNHVIISYPFKNET